MKLKQAIKHGLVLQNVHRAMRFKQRAYLKEFIDLNADLRKEAMGNEFQQKLLKLISNACYGKFLENPLKRHRLVLATNKKQIMKLISKPEFVDRKIFDDELVAVELRHKKLVFDRPVIVGFAVLELSKTHMYSFHYDVVLKKYSREDVEICYMDTDSFIYLIRTEDVYRDMLEDLRLYDTSNYPDKHPCFSAENYKKMGTFKDETGGDPIVEFCGLRSKMYQYSTKTKYDMRAKGIDTFVLKNTITPNDYINTLYTNNDVYRTNRQFQGFKHKIFSVERKKKALSSHDDKRVVLQGNVVTVPYGHKCLKRRSEISSLLKVQLAEFDRTRLKSRVTEDEESFSERLERLDRERSELVKLNFVEENACNPLKRKPPTRLDALECPIKKFREC